MLNAKEPLSFGAPKKVMLVYPPGPLYQRGEDRSQGNIDQSTATSMRPANDLGYAAAMLKADGHQIFLRDYPSEGMTEENILSDFQGFRPQVLFVSITNSTINADLKVISRLKKIDSNIVVILKGALFFDAADELLQELDLSNVDYLIGGESEFIIADLVKFHYQSPTQIAGLYGLIYRDQGRWVKTDFSKWETDLSKLQMPDRSAMKNQLYLRPDTGEPQATIVTSRGCGASCIYCLTPRISGKRIRKRDPNSILAEIEECYTKYGIRNFFFRSDTFTMDRVWVLELCAKIKKSPVAGKIEWVANSRVNPLELETLKAMKDAGCWLVAFGFESGSDETLLKIKKGAGVEDNRRAAELCRQAGLKIFGFFLIGLPWEDWSHLKQTEALIFELNCDFIELHLAVPYHGTELYKIAKEAGVLGGSPLNRDYFNSPTVGTKTIQMQEIEKFRKRLLLRYHLRPTYILARIKDVVSRPRIIRNYLKFGFRLLKNTIR